MKQITVSQLNAAWAAIGEHMDTPQGNILNAQATLDKLFRNLSRQKATAAATESHILITQKYIKELELELQQTNSKKRP